MFILKQPEKWACLNYVGFSIIGISKNCCNARQGIFLAVVLPLPEQDVGNWHKSNVQPNNGLQMHSYSHHKCIYTIILCK